MNKREAHNRKTPVAARLMSVLCTCCFLPQFACAENVVRFSTADPGNDKDIQEWGIEVAWIDADHVRQSKFHMTEPEVDMIFANFFLDKPLDSEGKLDAKSREIIDAQVASAAALPNAKWGIGPNVGDTHEYYMKDGKPWPERWAALMKATIEYYKTAHNKDVIYVMPFNEPDYWRGQGSPEDLANVLKAINDDPYFKDIRLMGPSTLSSDPAIWYYDQVKDGLGYGTTHLLGGSLDSFIKFFQHVIESGDKAHNPELHSLAEAIVCSEYGISGAAWWSAVMRPRGLFIRTVHGKQLGYGENRPAQSSAAVYRAPDGEVYGFAGVIERFGALTPWRFVCTDREVYFNGIGPIREYTLPVNVGQDAYVEIDFDDNIAPALDGKRWKLVNKESGLQMTLVPGALEKGADIAERKPVAGDLDQQWDVTRNRDGYIRLTNAASGRAAELADWSLEDGANVRQNEWPDTGYSMLQHWYLEDAGDGCWYIRNGHSNKCLTGDGQKIFQSEARNAANQQWKFEAVPAPKHDIREIHFAFEGDGKESVGGWFNAELLGEPEFAEGKVGRALAFDGKDDFVRLPQGFLDSDDITIAAWVYWNGGDPWQRIFDFGNGEENYMMLTPKSADGELRFSFVKGGAQTDEAVVTDALPIGEWVHVAVTIEGNACILYIDGKPRVAGQVQKNPSQLDAKDNYLGKSQWPDPMFNGRIDEFRVFNGALTREEVARLAEVAPPAKEVQQLGN